jgi:hypothetical protein
VARIFQRALLPSYPLLQTKDLLPDLGREPFANDEDTDWLFYPKLEKLTGSVSLIFFQFLPLFSFTDFARSLF